MHDLRYPVRLIGEKLPFAQPRQALPIQPQDVDGVPVDGTLQQSLLHAREGVYNVAVELVGPGADVAECRLMAELGGTLARPVTVKQFVTDPKLAARHSVCPANPEKKKSRRADSNRQPAHHE